MLAGIFAVSYGAGKFAVDEPAIRAIDEELRIAQLRTTGHA